MDGSETLCKQDVRGSIPLSSTQISRAHTGGTATRRTRLGLFEKRLLSADRAGHVGPTAHGRLNLAVVIGALRDLHRRAVVTRENGILEGRIALPTCCVDRHFTAWARIRRHEAPISTDVPKRYRTHNLPSTLESPHDGTTVSHHWRVAGDRPRDRRRPGPHCPRRLSRGIFHSRLGRP